MIVFRRIQKFIAVILLLSSLYVLFNNVYFLHSHYLFGQFIIHSHPYSKTQDANPIKRHQHSSNSLFLISLMNKLFFTVIFSSSFYEAVLKRSIVGYFLLQIRSNSNNSQYLFHLRAPPNKSVY
jgi:hypothetical protein